MRFSAIQQAAMLAVPVLALTACSSTAKPLATPVKVVERAVLPPVPTELFAEHDKPAAPLSGSPKDLLEHAADYGAWCRKRDAQVQGWQDWYREGKQYERPD